jgi:hypothetical protein
MDDREPALGKRAARRRGLGLSARDEEAASGEQSAEETATGGRRWGGPGVDRVSGASLRRNFRHGGVSLAGRSRVTGCNNS